MICEYTETEYKDHQYSCGPAPDFDRSCWTNVKTTMGLDFPNLPYLIDGKLALMFLKLKLKIDFFYFKSQI
jgi:glutathione S-transferase